MKFLAVVYGIDPVVMWSGGLETRKIVSKTIFVQQISRKFVHRKPKVSQRDYGSIDCLEQSLDPLRIFLCNKFLKKFVHRNSSKEFLVS